MKSLLLVIMPAIIISTSGCRKKEDMVGRVKVVYAGSPSVIVPDARVELYQNDIRIVGYTNSNGIYEFTFRLKMKLNVTARKDTATVTNSPELTGIGTIAMGRHGEDSETTIYLSN
ncbi:MAG: hypothetical protein ACOC4R_03025 [Bacteroidota bacterium]